MANVDLVHFPIPCDRFVGGAGMVEVQVKKFDLSTAAISERLNHIFKMGLTKEQRDALDKLARRKARRQRGHSDMSRKLIVLACVVCVIGITVFSLFGSVIDAIFGSSAVAPLYLILGLGACAGAIWMWSKNTVRE